MYARTFVYGSPGPTMMRKTILRKVLFEKIDENTVGHPSSVPDQALVRLGAKLGPKINVISFIF